MYFLLINLIYSIVKYCYNEFNSSHIINNNINTRVIVKYINILLVKYFKFNCDCVEQQINLSKNTFLDCISNYLKESVLILKH